MTDRVATVIIGRNEGARLARSLASVAKLDATSVYVDSHSTDDSVAIAAAAGSEVVEMPAGMAASAALARNLGTDHLVARHPDLTYIQFIDGDCTVEPTFVAAAIDQLDADPGLAAVCGYRVEAEPHRNVFHRIAQVEWQMGAVGDVADFAGDVVLRVAALRSVGGYAPEVVAGEDTELSSRLVAAGWRIRRVDLVSTVHDIAMSRPSEWWARARRGGYGAHLIARRNRRTDRLFVEHVRRSVVWGLVAPVAAVAALPRTRVPLALLAARYVVAGLRAAAAITSRRVTTADRLVWGFSSSLSAVPSAVGVIQYAVARTRGRAPALVEYKGTSPSSHASAAPTT